MAKLSDKQELFCLEYLKDLNATQAAKRAGYSPKTAVKIASDNLTKVDIQERIAHLNSKRFNKVELEGMNVIRELALLSFSDIKDYITVDEDTGAVKINNLDNLPGKASKAIKSIKEKRVIREGKGKAPDMILDNTLEFTLWDKNKALEQLGRHHSLFTDKLIVEKSKFEDKTDDELLEELKDLQG